MDRIYRIRTYGKRNREYALIRIEYKYYGNGSYFSFLVVVELCAAHPPPAPPSREGGKKKVS